MQVVDLPPVPEFDATPFVTYQTEEFTTPTEAELVETLPNMPVFEAPAEKPLRRGKGYLRAEISENEAAAPTEELEDFGAGVVDESTGTSEEVPDAESPAAEDATVVKSESAAEDLESQDGSEQQEARPGKKRRRRRRRRGRGDRPEDDSADTSASDGGSEGAETAGESGTADDKPAKRRKRRRNRRRRGKGKPTDSDSSGGGDSEAGGSDDRSPSGSSES